MSPDATVPQVAAPRRVLLVDDDEFVRGLLSRQLAGLGAVAAATASSGDEALVMLREHGPFDLVICDLQMPGMDGVEFLRHLAVTHPGAAVIVISAQDRKVLRLTGELVMARGLRLLGSLTKPVATSDLGLLLETLSYTPGLTPSAAPHAVSTEQLRAALSAGEIDVHVQPKVDTRTRKLVGVEALARWTRPDGQRVPPAKFIQMAEQAGMLDALTDDVLRRALVSCGDWARQGLVTRIALNFAASSLQRLQLPELITDLAAECGVEPRQIIIEITESGVLCEGARSLDVLTRLRLRGFTLSIDDFGTGYSSLGQLQRLPFSELKIDQSFVSGMLTNPESARIVESTLRLARDLELTVTGEGVETEPQLQRLAQLGCEHAQGYLIARPFPCAELPSWVSKHDAA